MTKVWILSSQTQKVSMQDAKDSMLRGCFGVTIHSSDQWTQHKISSPHLLKRELKSPEEANMNFPSFISEHPSSDIISLRLCLFWSGFLSSTLLSYTGHITSVNSTPLPSCHHPANPSTICECAAWYHNAITPQRSYTFANTEPDHRKFNLPSSRISIMKTLTPCAQHVGHLPTKSQLLPPPLYYNRPPHLRQHPHIPSTSAILSRHQHLTQLRSRHHL